MHKINFKAMPPGVLVIKILKSSVPFCINIKSLSPAKRMNSWLWTQTGVNTSLSGEVAQ
jgi:hypothetical protein